MRIIKINLFTVRTTVNFWIKLFSQSECLIQELNSDCGPGYYSYRRKNTLKMMIWGEILFEIYIFWGSGIMYFQDKTLSRQDGLSSAFFCTYFETAKQRYYQSYYHNKISITLTHATITTVLMYLCSRY